VRKAIRHFRATNHAAAFSRRIAMAEKATILIPDISGFTEFTGKTELDHSSHIINELLDLIVRSNELGLTLAEIEGDAVLFYRKGEPPPKKDLVEQCLNLFKNFHVQLKIIERDTICQCGACQTATNLTLKFIIHFGEVKEIKVAQFTKATGLDMIIAHRLLKNSIASHEYILISAPCLRQLPDQAAAADLRWHSAQEKYAAIGNVEFEYAELSALKAQIPAPPPREEFVIVKGNDNLEVTINAPLRQVYQSLISVDERINWEAVDKIEREPVTERIGMRHHCQVEGMTLENTALYSEFKGAAAIYVERTAGQEMNLDMVQVFEMKALADKITRLNVNINWQQTQLPSEMMAGLLQIMKASFESFKKYCESKTPDD
jgi:class 3 adenylate cyclase